MGIRLRRAGAVALAVVLGGCGQWITQTDPTHPSGCSSLDDPKIVLDGISYGSTTLAVGETRSFGTDIAPFTPRYSSQSCAAVLSLGSLKWTGDSLRASDARTRARLVSCGDCTVLYEDRPETSAGGTAVVLTSAVQLNAATQRIVFSVTGVAPGLATFEIYGYAPSDTQRLNYVAHTAVQFRVVAQ